MHSLGLPPWHLAGGGDVAACFKLRSLIDELREFCCRRLESYEIRAQRGLISFPLDP